MKFFPTAKPILMAAMNRGSTVELAVAVDRAGGRGSLCSWTYEGQWDRMHRDLDRFRSQCPHSTLHCSFELEEFSDPEHYLALVSREEISTVEVIYGKKTAIPNGDWRRSPGLALLARQFLEPTRQLGLPIFRRVTQLVDRGLAEAHGLTGFCVKGSDAAGCHGSQTTLQMVERQQRETPDHRVIAYGGVGTAQQVKQYLDMGCETVGVGTRLAFSRESPIRPGAKQWVIDHSSKDIIDHLYEIKPGRWATRNALDIHSYQGPDPWSQHSDPVLRANALENRTASLEAGLFDQRDNHGHLMIGHAIDQVTDILSVNEIIEELCSLI